jgi:hypothetical protein
MQDAVVIPGSGLVVSLDADLDEIGTAWDDLTSTERELRSVKRTISDEITRRLDFEGRRQITVGHLRFETTAPEEREWDMVELQTLLRQLVGEGTISEQKAERCIRWEPKVVWSEVKALVGDPRCAKRMEQTFTMVPASRYAKVTRA